MKRVFETAHALTRQFISTYGGDYRGQFIVTLKMLCEEKKNIKLRLERLIEEKRQKGITSINVYFKNGVSLFGDVDCIDVNNNNFIFRDFLMEKYIKTTRRTSFHSLMKIDYRLVDWVS